MHKQQGITLVELMISITLGLILMGGVIQMFVASKQTFSTQQGLSRVQEAGRLAVEMIAQDIRMAGYMGCGARQFAANEPGSGGICSVPNSPGCLTNGLRPSGDDLLNFDGPAILGAGPGDYTLNGPVANTIGEDVLVMRSGGNVSLSLTQQTGGASSVVNQQSADGCLADICIDDIIVISDCSQGRILHVTNINQGGGDGDGQGRSTFVHNSGQGNNPGNWTGPGNQWGQDFDPGAEVFKVSNIAYFTGAAQGGRQALWRQINNRNAVQLIEGIEDMHLTFSVDNGVTYVSRGDVPDWDQVHSVRINLLVSSVDDNVTPEAQTITFRDEAVDTSDRRMRQVFTSTVAVRNRLP